MYANEYEYIESLSDLDKVEQLKNMLINRATGGEADNGIYVRLRRNLISKTELNERLPRFVKTCRSTDEFWSFIKSEIEGNGSYEKRRRLIREAFDPLLSYLESIELQSDSTIELSSVKEASTIDEELNLLIEEAKTRFKNPKDKKIALEKLWDAFERIKTYYGDNKKLSAEELVRKISSDFDYEFIKNEFKELTRIGNNYNIRHHEKDKEIIKEEKHVEYLFFRMLALLNLCVSNIQDQEENEWPF